MRYTPCHAEEANRLTKHLLPLHTVEAVDSSTPLRCGQNDRAHLTTDFEITHDVSFYFLQTRDLDAHLTVHHSDV